jgi:hypothetical protein
MRSRAAQSRYFEEGTDYVPETRWFLLHKGERVVPAEENHMFLDFVAAQAGAGWIVPYRRGRDVAAEGKTLITDGMHGGTVVNNWYDVSNDDIRTELARLGCRSSPRHVRVSRLPPARVPHSPFLLVVAFGLSGLSEPAFRKLGIESEKRSNFVHELALGGMRSCLSVPRMHLLLVVTDVVQFMREPSGDRKQSRRLGPSLT